MEPNNNIAPVYMTKKELREYLQQEAIREAVAVWRRRFWTLFIIFGLTIAVILILFSFQSWEGKGDIFHIFEG